MSVMREPPQQMPTPEMISAFLGAEEVSVALPNAVSETNYSVLEGHGFTDGAKNIGRAILSDPTGATLGSKMPRIDSQDLLQVVVPRLGDEAIAHAIDVNGYGPEIRRILLAVPEDRLESVLSGVKSRRSKSIADSFVQSVSKPEIATVGVQSEVPGRYRIKVDGKSKGIVKASSYQDALAKSKAPTSGAKAVTIELL